MLQRSILTILAILIAIPISAESKQTIRNRLVDCDSGRSIQTAVRRARSGDTIRVKGTCLEQIIITTDRITLDGGGTAIISGNGGNMSGDAREGVITVDGAQDVTIDGVTVQNGPDGINCRRGSACIVRNTIARDNSDDGFAVNENSTINLVDSTAQSNGNNGINADASSSILFGGTVSSDDNSDNGITILGSHVDIGGATLRVNNNTRGIIVLNSGSITLLATENSVITANGNSVDGILLLSGGKIFIGNGSITTSNNRQDGLSLVSAGGVLATGGSFKADGNGRMGVNLVSNSSFSNIASSFLVEDNFIGFSVNGASTMFSSPPGSLIIRDNTEAGLVAGDNSGITLSGVTITNNKLDVSLTFGVTATLEGNTIASVICDETVLIRGDTGC